MTALLRYEQARAALAECRRVDEVKDIRDKAEAMAAYARQAKDAELIAYATEIKVRAEKRCGELTLLIEKAAGGRPIKNSSHDATSFPKAEVLAAAGISKHEASRYERIATMPPEQFEAAIATAKEKTGRVTTAHMLRAAKETKPVRHKRPPPKRQTAASKRRLAELERVAGTSMVSMYARLLLRALQNAPALGDDDREILGEIFNFISQRN